jgi:acetyl-CoA acetyltransferase
MFCSPAEGGVALVLASEKKARELGKPLIRLKAATMRTRPPGSFEVFAPSIDIKRGGTATRIASTDAFRLAGIGPEDIAVAQLQDTEAGAEIMHMAENGFCRDGEQERWLAEGLTEIGRFTKTSCSSAVTAAGARCPAILGPPTAMSMVPPACRQ